MGPNSFGSIVFDMFYDLVFTIGETGIAVASTMTIIQPPLSGLINHS